MLDVNIENVDGRPMIYDAICGVMKDVGAVGKDSENTFDRYKFRGIDAVMNALYPAMVKNGLFVIPEVLEQSREDRISKKGDPLIYSVSKVKYTFYAKDGSSVSAVVIGEGMDRGDKSMNKAMSAAFKYACFQTFCIPTEEMQDSEKDSPEVGKSPAMLEKISAADVASLRNILSKPQTEWAYKKYGVSDFSMLTNAQFGDLMRRINERRADEGKVTESAPA